jgi:V8-like Glu-specific endopeptidase
LRRFSLVVWLLILGFLVYPAQNVTAQSGDSLFLPYVHTPASAQNTPISDVVVSQDISVASQQEALNFWTHEALAAAKPMVMPVQSGPATVDEAAIALSDAVGAPGFSNSGAAAPDAASIAQAAYPEDWAALASEADSPSAVDGTSQVYDHYVVNQNAALWKIYPHVWIGRLSFQTPGGTSYCTGTSISNNVMLTAAHCIYDTTNNRFYSNWVLTPAYRNGTAPYGSFPATTCWVLTSWVNLSGGFSINSWTRYDVGVCKMGTNSAGTTLNNAVGWMGRQWNYGYVRHYNIFGYPFNDYNDATIANAGKYLHVCSAESFQQTTDTIGAGCNVSRGMSGGPWMVGYAPTLVAGAANGVSSGFFIGTQNLYSARFTSNNIVPLCTAAGC